MKVKHIYWFAYFNADEPSVRYRAIYPLQELAAKYGITHNIVYPGYDLKSLVIFILTFLEVLLFRKNNSVIVFQKIYTTGIYSFSLRVLLYFRRSQTYYDIDDAEYTRHPAAVMHYFMKKCSACVGGSASLCTYMLSLNKNVLLLTSPVIKHDIQKKIRNERLTIGWIGYYSAHRQNLLELFFPALLQVDFPVTIKLLGVRGALELQEIRSYFRHNSNVSIDAPTEIDWHHEKSIYGAISTFDVAVSPLINTEFNRAKSAFKLKQCLSCGIPVLASSIGENIRFIDDGKNGFFCDSPDQYYQRLVLIKNCTEQVYLGLSTNAINSFDSFSVDDYCKRFINYLESESMVITSLAKLREATQTSAT